MSKANSTDQVHADEYTVQVVQSALEQIPTQLSQALRAVYDLRGEAVEADAQPQMLEQALRALYLPTGSQR